MVIFYFSSVNYFLENYHKAAVSAEIKNHYAGLARYYRADFYMSKIKRYSNVPWFSGTLDPGDQDLYTDTCCFGSSLDYHWPDRRLPGLSSQ